MTMQYYYMYIIFNKNNNFMCGFASTRLPNEPKRFSRVKLGDFVDDFGEVTRIVRPLLRQSWLNSLITKPFLKGTITFGKSKDLQKTTRLGATAYVYHGRIMYTEVNK